VAPLAGGNALTTWQLAPLVSVPLVLLAWGAGPGG
jgi:hypothetical protein